MNQIDFLLVPDRYAARYLRRFLTDRGARLSLVVGTINELVEHARGAYLLPKVTDSWSGRFVETASGMADTFWAESLKSHEREAQQVLESSLTKLLEESLPKELCVPPSCAGMSGLAERHLKDLVALHEAMKRQLPPTLATAMQIINHQTPPTLATLRVHTLPDFPDLKPWQSSLVDRLNRDGAHQTTADLRPLMQEAFGSFLSAKTTTTNIAHLAQQLFLAQGTCIPLDGSLQWIATRDYLEEAEVVAGQIQTLLATDKNTQACDLALLLPADPRYAQAVKDVFTQTGIPLSGIGGRTNQRDLGHEVLFHFLMVMQKPVTVMAWAALLTSPFMPWSARTSHILAQSVADGRFAIDQMPVKSGPGRAMLELLAKNLKDASPREFMAELMNFVALLDFSAEDLDDARRLFDQCFAECQSCLRQSGTIDWNQLRRITTPEVLADEREDAPTRQGVAVFQESGEPWRQVKHLFVLGFADGHYPQEPGYSPIFTDQDLVAFNTNSGLTIETNSQITSRNRQRFKRQLASSAETITFLFSRKAPLGDTLHASATLPFMVKLFEGIEESAQLVLEMDRKEDRLRMRWLAELPSVSPTLPRALAIDDLDLGIDLLGIWPQKNGSMRTQSPSRLANLMTAPLAWLFDWVSVKPLEWAPETMDPATKGTLAHEVFEHLFLPDKPLPAPDEITTRVPGLLANAIRNKVPFLQSSEWNVERNHLESDILKSALHWRELLESTGIRVIGNEIKLYGEFDGVPLKGFADVILTMPDGRIIVGDYKKSSSGKRKKQMEAGLDSQTSIYRIMLEKGRISSKQNVALPVGISANNIAVLYYTLNDQVVLTDTTGWLPPDPSIKELGSGIADEAMVRLGARFAEVRKGCVMLNSSADEKTWDKVGVKLYCLDNSPLLRMFMHDEEVSS